MKTLKYILCVLAIFLSGCAENYELNVDFSVPTELSGPAEVNIDLQSSENIVLSWNGGAEDGGVLLYNVLFDSLDGDFSNPVYSAQSDFGGSRQLTLTPVILNKIARAAGLKSGETGKVKWTVEASRGGVIKQSQASAEISVTRPDGEIPEQLYLRGTATENNGETPIPFRKVSDGIFVVYTQLDDGNLYFTDAEDNGVNYTVDNSGKLTEGEEPYNVQKENNVVRLTLNFNTKSIRKEIITRVRMIWGANFEVITEMPYVGNGTFKHDNVYIQCFDPNDSSIQMPPGISWFEERYYFIVTIDGNDWCWGRGDGISAEQPAENESLSFFELHEFAWSQWEHLWKMRHFLHKKHCTVTIRTNENGMMIHSFSDIK